MLLHQQSTSTEALKKSAARAFARAAFIGTNRYLRASETVLDIRFHRMACMR
jgi:hypothetical protein